MLCSYSYARRSASVIAGSVSVGCAVFAGCPLLTQSGHARPQIAASQLDPEPPISSAQRSLSSFPTHQAASKILLLNQLSTSGLPCSLALASNLQLHWVTAY